MIPFYRLLGSLLLLSPLAGGLLHAETVQPHSLAELLKRDNFNQIKISPDGKHYALSLPTDDRTLLRIVRSSDMATTAGLNPGSNTHVSNLVWVNDERLLFSVEEKIGELDQPRPTGEIFAINADGSRQELLYGMRAEGGKLGSRLDKGRQEYGSAWLLDVVAGDDRKILINVWPWARKSEPYSQVDELDVYSGRRNRVALAPVQRASFVTDPAGQVRFATGAGVDNRLQTWHRADNSAKWELLNDEGKSHRQMVPLGFSADGRTAYLQIEEAEGPDGIYALDTASGEQTLALRGDFGDPYHLLHDPTGRILIGAIWLEGKPVMRYFNRKDPHALLYRMLELSFPGHMLIIGSSTRGGAQALLHVSSDHNPGDYYLFDVAQKKADLLQPAREWIDPRRTARKQAIDLQARDGMRLHGYLTVPPGKQAEKLPMIVVPHGGPFGVADTWGFDTHAQVLAARGFAVLQLNFRGSGYYGRAYLQAGLRQWGRAMQDDLTDATRWAIEAGIADAERICIAGASYGAYAALMGVAKEPDLYRCAAGNVGVYDLPLMYRRGDIRQQRSGRNYLEEALGKEDLESISPTRLADRIKVPVFLAAGGKDERAPPDHTRAMEKALQDAKVPVQTLIFPTEGHGFYVDANRQEFYEKLLAFFDEHIGARTD